MNRCAVPPGAPASGGPAETKGQVHAYTVEIEETTPQLVAATRLHGSLRKIEEMISGGFARITSELGRVNIEATGDPLVVYYDEIDEEREADFEACVPIPVEMPGGSAVYSRELEGGAVAATVHRGPYQDIRPAYDALNRWIFERGHGIAGPPREIYLNDPRTVQPADLLTRVEFPIRPTSD